MEIPDDIRLENDVVFTLVMLTMNIRHIEFDCWNTWS